MTPVRMVGKRYGHLEVLAEAGRVGPKRAVLVECSCGQREVLPVFRIRGSRNVPGYNYCKSCRLVR